MSTDGLQFKVLKEALEQQFEPPSHEDLVQMAFADWKHQTRERLRDSWESTQTASSKSLLVIWPNSQESNNRPGKPIMALVLVL